MTVSAKLEGRVKRLERVVDERAFRGTPEGAYAALMAGDGTDADLEILYVCFEANLLEQLTTFGVDCAVMAFCGWRPQHWIGSILSCPPDADVPVHYREELAKCAEQDNPYHVLVAARPRFSAEERDELVEDWIFETLAIMVFERHDEAELRAEVAARVPIGAEVGPYVHNREKQLKADRRKFKFR